MKMQLCLRPHHLLCIQKFRGHGYTPEFTEHMTSVTAALAGDPAAQITLVKGCDELCRKCPNNLQGRCTTLQKVAFMDDAVLAAGKLAYGDSASWDALAKTAREKIFSTDEFPKVCGSCQWYELCKKI